MRRALALFALRHLARCLAALSFTMSCVGALAQDWSQVCIQAFADQNGDGQLGEIEPPIIRGVAASLLDERGVTIRSQLLKDSAYAADGLLCFDQLFQGEYQVIISSSEYMATTPTTARAGVDPGSAPAIINFGAKPLTQSSAEAVATGLTALDGDARQTLLVAGAAAIMAVVGMSLLGSVLFALILRRRIRARTRSPAAGRSPSAPVADTSQLSPRLTKDPGEGSPPLFTDEDQAW